jgi:hypothetical protein
MPAVSKTWKLRFFQVKAPSTTSLVVPGMSLTIEADDEVSLLLSVDFPVLGLPIMAIRIGGFQKGSSTGGGIDLR